MDSIEVQSDQYLVIDNFNFANKNSDYDVVLQQNISIGITNTYQNLEFDVFIFSRGDNVNDSAEFNCYMEAVKAQNWTADCNITNSSTTLVLLRKALYFAEINTVNDSNSADLTLVIDNSPYPLLGA
eukprot:CAMPEP_0170540278 /NCGR_PEP_ID=MMETSP0211-20121228/303_1 /TAXON_ID=311385 /ORGANISM="Pseudokeronopsis sp., Strain OXSARD2" /LENGTH=126 /DNA_ID=CAMNT_0010842621 /DNA_START=51 /DNA_END=431 /DNA_ORIENTATION=-